MSNSIIRSHRAVGLLLLGATVVGACAGGGLPGRQTGGVAAGSGSDGVEAVPTWPADTAGADGSTGPSRGPDASTAPPSADVAGGSGGSTGGGGGSGGSGSGSAGSAATDPQVVSLSQQVDAALSELEKAMSDDASQQNQDEGGIP